MLFFYDLNIPMKRFFAFGCSFTYYSYPTWADIVGSQYDEYYNLGMLGCGNEFIENMVHEADFFKNLTSDDTVAVLLTGYSRNDSFIEGQWRGRGNVFAEANEQVYTPSWFQDHWSLEQGVLTTWRAERNIRQLLTSKGCNFRILAAMPMLLDNALNHYDSLDTPSAVSAKLLEISQDYDRRTEPRGGQYLVDSLKKRQDLYEFEGLGIDLHPTVSMHLQFVKQELPELYKPEMQTLADQWHAMVSRISKENWNNPVFARARGRRIGTLTF